MLTCRQLAMNASRYLDSDLPWRDRIGIRVHLMMCRHCGRYVDQLARTVSMLRATAEQAPGPGTDDRVIAAVRAARATDGDRALRAAAPSHGRATGSLPE